MRNIIKLYFIFVILIIATTSSFAQIFGIKGGANLSNFLFKKEDDNFNLENKMKAGFHLGPTVEFELNNLFSLETALLLTTKGFKINSTLPNDLGAEEPYKLKFNLYYIDIPVDTKVKFALNGFDIYGSFGPYLGIGIQGKGKSELNNEKESGTIKFGPEGNLKRLEFGLDFGAGIETNRLLFGLSYNLGLTYVSKYNEEMNRVFLITIGYRFRKKS